MIKIKNRRPIDILGQGLSTKAVNKYKNHFDFKAWQRENPELAECVSQNQKYHNIHQGDRCFILGNGPSLKDADLSKLKDEIVFGVNMCGLSDFYQTVNLSYWLCLDGVFFHDNNFYYDRDVVIQNMEYLSKNKKTVCFVPIEARNFIRGRRYDKKININYQGPVRLPMLGLKPMEDNDFDLCRFRYLSHSIAIDAVTAAIYMGFSEIYLLGCDASTIKLRMDALMGMSGESDLHFYSDQSDRNMFEVMTRKRGILFELDGEYGCFRNWNYINQYCFKHGIYLCNLSSRTLLDFIPRKKMEEVL